MWLAREFPGLIEAPVVETVWAMTPEQTKALNKVGNKLLIEEHKDRWKHTSVIAEASGARLV
jgi:hypothetical protein